MTTENNKDEKVNSLLDNCVSSLDIQAREDKKQQEIIRLMPEIKKRSALVSENESSFEAGIFCRGFVDGAEWRINSVWHPANHEPIIHTSLILAELNNGEFVLGYEFYPESVKRWAYVKDLLPVKED